MSCTSVVRARIAISSLATVMSNYRVSVSQSVQRHVRSVINKVIAQQKMIYEGWLKEVYLYHFIA